MKKNEKTNSPIYSRQLGTIRASVWENESEEGGRVFHNVTLSRSYRDKNGDWKETAATFNGVADLALVCEAARLAANAIEERERELEANDQ